jgi:hypothetical protein
MDEHQVFYMIVLAILIAIGVYLLVGRSKDNITKDFYGDIISHQYAQISQSPSDLIATLISPNNQERKGKLINVISLASPGDKIGVISYDNNIIFRRNLESEEPIKQILVPFISQELNKKGLKLSVNLWDKNEPQVDLKKFSSTYDYPKGYFMSIV